MLDLCFNSMNRSAYILRDEDPDLEGQIDAAGRAGFAAFGPDIYSIRHYREEKGDLEGLAARIEAAGLRTFELPSLSVDEHVAQVRADVDEMAEVAQVLRPEFVQVNVTSEISDGVVDELRRAADRVALYGAGLAVEYLPWLPGTRNLETTRELMHRAQIPGAGIIVDTWHFFFSDDTWQGLEALPLSEISYIQFDDHPALESGDLVEETLDRRVMPGEGTFELGRFCDMIRSKGFDGVVSCEILSKDTRQMARDEFAQRVYETSCKFWP